MQYGLCSNLIQTPLGIETDNPRTNQDGKPSSNLIQTPLGIETNPHQ